MNFLKYNYIYFTISGILIIASLVSLIFFGLNPSIDFTGGSLIEVKFENRPSNEQITEIFQSQEYTPSSIQTVEDTHAIIKLDQINQTQSQILVQALSQELDQSVQILRFENIGPTLGRELLVRTLIATVLASSFILLYVAWTFKDLPYGVTAILAMFHDTLILIGSFSLIGKIYGIEIDTLFVTAVLTTLSFSVHDTVVVFDRIRESITQYPKANFTDIANKSLTETMTRSLNNSLTIIFMLAALALLGGATIRWFVTALLIGTVLGTYSSPFVAVPLLVLWNKRINRIKN